jgi:hypothetical protein
MEDIRKDVDQLNRKTMYRCANERYRGYRPRSRIHHPHLPQNLHRPIRPVPTPTGSALPDGLLAPASLCFGSAAVRESITSEDESRHGQGGVRQSSYGEEVFAGPGLDAGDARPCKHLFHQYVCVRLAEADTSTRCTSGLGTTRYMHGALNRFASRSHKEKLSRHHLHPIRRRDSECCVPGSVGYSPPSQRNVPQLVASAVAKKRSAQHVVW